MADLLDRLGSEKAPIEFDRNISPSSPKIAFFLIINSIDPAKDIAGRMPLSPMLERSGLAKITSDA